MRAASLVVLLALSGGCGRVHFDPLDDGIATGDASSDGLAGGDGEVCATPRVLPIGSALADQTIGSADDYPGQCGGGVDVVYALVQPASGMRTVTVSGTFRGAMAISSTCPPSGTGTCGNFDVGTPIQTGIGLAAGTHYVVIDKISGTGTTFTIGIQ